MIGASGDTTGQVGYFQLTGPQTPIWRLSALGFRHPPHREKGITVVQRREVVLVCDLCGSEDMVETHRIIVDGTARDAEACSECWSTTLAGFAAWATQGRAPLRKRANTKDAVSWPDTPWKFTPHAMQRMGERKISPTQILRVLAEQEIRRPGNTADSEIWVRGGIKVVVVPDSQVVLTASKQDKGGSDVYPVAV